MIRLIHGDCNTFMKDVPDKAFDLAIVDPPYGLPKDAVHDRGKLKNRAINSMNMEWDIAPDKEYFTELIRVSKNQIIWGGNYFNLPPCRCFVCWDKVQPWENFSQVEFAWTSFNYPSKLYKYDNRTGNKIHPTQKPIYIYKKLLKDFAKEGDKILDTHLGSVSSVIACIDGGFDMTGIEIDEDYFKAGVQRVQNHVRQLDMFIERPEIIIENITCKAELL
jgi:site-specific DNA-methyltransferase (adenine-specific)